jgi:RHS repeat-associated protein
MKAPEIGLDQYTAEYWEYDARIGRRWNVDPIGKAYESPYACFSNNPISYTDPKGNVATGVGDDDPTKYTVKKGDNITSIAKHLGTSVKELLSANKQIKNPNKILIGENINLPLKTLIDKYENMQSEVFPGLTRKEQTEKVEGAFNLNEQDAQKLVLATVHGAQENLVAQSPMLQKWKNSFRGIQQPSSNTSVEFTRKIFEPMLSSIIKGFGYTYGAGAVAIAGGEAPIIALCNDKSVEAYVVTNMLYNNLRQKAIIGIAELAATIYGKDIIYKKEFWTLSDEFKEYKQIDPTKIPETVTKIIEKLSEIFKK